MNLVRRESENVRWREMKIDEERDRIRVIERDRDMYREIVHIDSEKDRMGFTERERERERENQRKGEKMRWIKSNERGRGIMRWIMTEGEGKVRNSIILLKECRI